MDSANGNIVWSRNLGLMSSDGPELHVEGMWTVRDHSKGGPVLAVLATRNRGVSRVSTELIQTPETVAYHINALTGYAGEVDSTTGLPLGKTLFEGSIQTAFLLPYENCSTKNRVLGVVDQTSKVSYKLNTLTQLHLFPFCKKMAKQIAADSEKLSYTTLDLSLDGPILRGHSPNGDLTGDLVLWSKHFAPHQVVTATPAEYESIAAFGKVKGDKSTLYKYLNPHLLVVTSVSPSQSGMSTVSVVDSITGRVVYEVDIVNVDPAKGIIATMVENWLVYWWRDGNGWRLASVELYEDRSMGKAET